MILHTPTKLYQDEMILFKLYTHKGFCPRTHSFLIGQTGFAWIFFSLNHHMRGYLNEIYISNCFSCFFILPFCLCRRHHGEGHRHEMEIGKPGTKHINRSVTVKMFETEYGMIFKPNFLKSLLSKKHFFTF